MHQWMAKQSIKMYFQTTLFPHETAKGFWYNNGYITNKTNKAVQTTMRAERLKNTCG
jgi:hypothetical protein